MTDEKKHFILPNTQPIAELECRSAFNKLTANERMYAHYISQASWSGGLITLIQTSPESPLIFSLLHRIFLAQPIGDLKAAALATGSVNEDDFTAFLVYACGFLSNSGNYKGMGDSKILPNLDEVTFDVIVRSSGAWAANAVAMGELWAKCRGPIFLLNERSKTLGLAPQGLTTYFSDNCDKTDADLVNNWMKIKKLEGYNCRTFKTVNSNGKTLYNIKLASVDTNEKEGITIGPEEYKDAVLQVSRGDYSLLLTSVIKHLESAKDYAANDHQYDMLNHYIKSFQWGSLDRHKAGSL